MDSLKENVTRGAQWLDSVAPGWFMEVDTKHIHMMSLRHCILGQVFGEWRTGMKLLCGYPDNYPYGIREVEEAVVAVGMKGAFCDPAVEPFWLEEIQARKSGLPPSVQVTDSSLDAAREPQLVG